MYLTLVLVFLIFVKLPLSKALSALEIILPTLQLPARVKSNFLEVLLSILVTMQFSGVVA